MTEQVSTAQLAPFGKVVTIGLSGYDGIHFSLSGGIYSASRPGAMAIAVGAGKGTKLGYGSRLQYSTYGNDGSYKITATTDEDGSSRILVGITDISKSPFSDMNGNGDYEAESDRLSGNLGTIVNDTKSGDRNGTGNDATTKIYTDYGGITPSMYRLFIDVEKTIISGIDGNDAWTGTTVSEGAQLFYDMAFPCVCWVTYTIAAEA